MPESVELLTIYKMGDKFLIKVASDPVEYFSGGQTADDLSSAIRRLVEAGLERRGK